MAKIKIGLLPLWLKLYDEFCAEQRPSAEAFTKQIAEEYICRSIEVIQAPICMEKKDFDAAVIMFETEKVDLILTLHLAYSPSLESIDALARTRLPLVILDTTPEYDFGFEQEKAAIMHNHGIHGVQDMCNMLIRKDKSFIIEAGHWKESDVIERTIKHFNACRMSSAMTRAKVGIIGNPFKGMGDFFVDFHKLENTIGMKVISADMDSWKSSIESISEAEIDQESQININKFESESLSKTAMHNTSASCLAVRKWIETENLDAFTVNFLDITKESGLPVVPFLEASRAMTQGKGYAGEGDVLTAALVGALMTNYPETTFSEMFCPDWKSNRVFLSHMGEINTDLCSDKVLLGEREFPFTDAGNPVTAKGCLKPGKACLVNLAPGPGDSYKLIASEVEMCDTMGKEKIHSVRGWFKTKLPINRFLEEYSKNGGTHHLAISYGANMNELKEFAEIMNWDFKDITNG